VIIRPARADELEAILELWSETGLGLRATDAPGSLEELLVADPDALLVAEEDGRIVGTLIAGWDGWRGNLYRLGVLPEYRRRGIGAALVREGERRLTERGAIRIVAAVGTDRRGADVFWEAVGYERDGSAQRFVRNL